MFAGVGISYDANRISYRYIIINLITGLQLASGPYYITAI